MDESVGIDYTGIQQMFEKGGIHPDNRSRWTYAAYDILTIDGLKSKAEHRLNKIFDPD